MKKSILLTGAMLAISSLGMSAFNNPKDADGNDIVKWDPETQAFAASNDWEVDETIIFAVDVTGTPLETALATPSRNKAVLGRSVAYDLYVTSAPEEASGKMNIDGRLFHIKGNIYGMVVNFFQQHVTRYADNGFEPNEDFTEYAVCTPGYVTSWGSNIFGFGWSADNAGAEWWDAVSTPIQGELSFTTAPYTGTKTSPEFYYGDLVPEDECPFAGLDAGAYHSMCDDWGGYAPVEYYDAAVKDNSGVESVKIGDSPVVSSEYFNISGQRVAQPADGLYIVRDIKADGSVVARKVVK